MMNNIRQPYVRTKAPKLPGVYPAGTAFLVYARESKGPRTGVITCRRKFATEEAANIFYNELQPDERI
jgi:hypothetical protein